MLEVKIKEIVSDVFAVVVPDNYERAMLFLRVQEFYESPYKKIRQGRFSIWDYFSMYSKDMGKGCFSYPSDFSGFNLPLIVAKKCYELNDPETPYDVRMMEIVEKIFVNGKRQYLVGVGSLSDSTFRHELAHALYYTNEEYRTEMDELTDSLSRSDFQKFKMNLKQIGYFPGVFKDEIQAYMSTEQEGRASKGVAGRKKLHQSYKKVFKKYRKKLGGLL